ncbi:MAG: integrase [bacterium]|nr:integrase [Curvibacter sp.]
MSATVLHFTPNAELAPQENLDAFIETCRRSNVLSASKQFDQNTWDIGYVKGQNKMQRAIFSTMEAAANRENEPFLPEPFLSFSKAALVYLHDRRPVVSQASRISALRFLEAALRDLNKGSRPTAVNEDVLDTAVELARNQLGAAAAYRVAGQLEFIADMMTSNEFISLRVRWAHGMKKPAELGSRISTDALQARQEKLPSAAALRALAGIFQEATELRDIVVSSYTALMACAPERVNEVLRLRRDALVRGDGRFTGKVGLRWPGSKGAEDTIKWLPTEMVPVAEKAMSNLLRATVQANELAEWYAANPNQIFLHPEAQYLRGKELLSSADIALILWGDADAAPSAVQWANARKELTKVPLQGRRVGYRFTDMETAVLSLLPETFPYVPGAPDLMCKDALGVIPLNAMASERATYKCMFSCIGYTNISMPLTGSNGQQTIFDKFHYTEDDGTPITFRTHSLRHYLNTLAQMGGMTSAEIALFSGRKDVSQNRAYDHMTSNEVQEPISQALKSGMNAQLSPYQSSRPVNLRSKFSLVSSAAGHTTEFGWCTHDFAGEPCQMHRDCINCEEQVCVKGEGEKEKNLRNLKAETEHLLANAKSAMNEKEYGADAWVKHQTMTLERINSLLAILEDPNVPTGAQVRLDIQNAPLIANSVEPARKPLQFKRRRALK